MPDPGFIRNVARGDVGEAFVGAHLDELTDTIVLNRRMRASEHVEGGDASALVVRLDEGNTIALPDYANPGIDNPRGIEITCLESGGTEVKTIWNYLFRTNDNEEPSGTLGFALWSYPDRNNYGWLIKILCPESFVGHRTVTAVQPLVLVFVLAEYEDVFACITFKNVPALLERLRSYADRCGFELSTDIPLGENAVGWMPEHALLIDNMWHVPLSELSDIADVTLIGAKPRLRSDIVLGKSVCRSSIQESRYAYLERLSKGKHLPADDRFMGAFTPDVDQRIFADIDHNLKLLESLDYEKYPALSRLRSMRVFEHLIGIMGCMLAYPIPVWPARSPRYFAISNAFFKQWLNDHRIQGSTYSVQASSIFLKDCGLIKAFRPIGETQDPIISGIMKSTGSGEARKNITLRSVPRYDESVLQHAEEISEVYLKAGVSLAKLRKADVIRIRGREIADGLYLDSRRISDTEEYVHSLYVSAVADLIHAKGYTTSTEVYAAVEDRMCKELNFVYIDPLGGELNDEERAQLDLQRRYFDALNKLAVNKRYLINDAGFVFRPLRNADREALSIPDDVKEWIITNP